MNTSPSESIQWTQALIHSRRTTLPKRLTGPGPDDAQKALILQSAAAAPDHEQLLPWRFVEVPQHCRTALGRTFEQALLARDPGASEEDRAQARDKAMRSPWLLLAIARTGGEPAEIPAEERLLSIGAAIQNMLLMATAMGLGSSLTSGKAMDSVALRALFNVNEHEQALCFVNIGHVLNTRKERPRPAVDRYFSKLQTD